MSRAVWFVVGTGAGVYGTVKARRLAYRLSPEGLTDQAASLGLGLRSLAADVREGMADREDQLLTQLGLRHRGEESGEHGSGHQGELGRGRRDESGNGLADGLDDEVADEPDSGSASGPEQVLTAEFGGRAPGGVPGTGATGPTPAFAARSHFPRRDNP